MRELEGRVAVVTGAASGIGRSLAGRLTVEGMHVVLADVEEPALRNAVAGVGADAVAFTTDVTSADAVEAPADFAYTTFGAVHLVCNTTPGCSRVACCGSAATRTSNGRGAST